jgi:hypothetical protein
MGISWVNTAQCRVPIFKDRPMLERKTTASISDATALREIRRVVSCAKGNTH